MKKIIKHDHFTGEYEFVEDENIWFGTLVGIRDLVTFESDTEEGIKPAFMEMIEEYKELCKEVGKPAPTPGTTKETLKAIGMLFLSILAAVTMLAILGFAALNLLGWI